LPGGPFSRRRT